VLGGMAMNLLLGALAAGLVLINNQYTQGLFVWARVIWRRSTGTGCSGCGPSCCWQCQC
jgi:hypothetical protein